MKIFKKNQVIIYVIALMLMTAGYLNYTTNNEKDSSLETSIQMESDDDTQLADIGDATLVNSNDLTSENETNLSTANTEADSNTISNNDLNENNTTTPNSTSNSNLNIDTNVVATENTNVKNNSNTTSNTIETSSSNTSDYFVKSKLERDTMYSQMIESYEKILNSSNSLETQKQTATQEITKINETKNKIMICENLIKTKGFENSVIFVNGDSISIIIGANEIKQEEVAQIQNIISREMGAQIENIHISTK